MQRSTVPSPLFCDPRGPLLPAVTKSWLRLLVLSFVFFYHSSTRGVVELLLYLFDYRISLFIVHYIFHSPVAQARRIYQQYYLSTIFICLLFEIFHSLYLVLVFFDALSTFCFFLSPYEHRTPIPGASGCWNWST